MPEHFSLVKTCGGARAGELRTAHGTRPHAGLPAGGQPGHRQDTHTGRGHAASASICCSANTYHLYLRPGIDIVRDMGGLHRFMAWDGAILTDSGGYQVFSLAPFRRVSDEGVTFRSHIDGSEHFLTPEQAVQYQEALGSDVMMVLDECSAHDAGREKIVKAMERTHRWAERCRQAWSRRNALYAIVQGGLFPDLRRQSAETLAALDFPGYAIGGLSLGEPKDLTLEMVALTTSLFARGLSRAT